MLQAGSLDFLANQGFDFNKFIYEGVPLLRASDRDMHLAKMDAQEAPAKPDILLNKPEDRELADRLISQVTEWLKVGSLHSVCMDLPKDAPAHALQFPRPFESCWGNTASRIC